MTVSARCSDLSILNATDLLKFCKCLVDVDIHILKSLVTSRQEHRQAPVFLIMLINHITGRKVASARVSLE